MNKGNRKCPNGAIVPVVTIQVCKIGYWSGKGPYGLFVNVLGGGAYQVNNLTGTKREMQALQGIALGELRNNWQPATCVCNLIASAISRMHGTKT